MKFNELNDFAVMVSRSPDLQEVMQDGLDLALHQVERSEAWAAVFLLDEQTGAMSAACHRGAPEDHPCLVGAPPGVCLCGLAARRAEEVFSAEGSRDDRHVCRWPNMRPHQDLCLPLKARDRVLGIMHLSLAPEREIAPGEHRVLRTVAGRLSLALENTRLSATLREQEAQLRGLSARLTAADEVGRRRLARELHDRVGQSMSVLSINLDLAQTFLATRQEERLASRLAESIALVQQTGEQVRDLLAELRPPFLDDQGLLAALRWYGARFTRQTDIVVNLQGREPSPRLPHEVELALFRIAQEALNNIAKHARATRVAITEEVEGSLVRLVIVDNGIGFTQSFGIRMEDRPHWGLMTMKERAAAVGAHCRIETRPGEGARIVVEARGEDYHFPGR